MTFPKYEAYKDSGVEWLKEVPEHWDVTRLHFIFEIVKRIAGTDGFDVLSITQKGIKLKDLDSGEGQLASDYSKYQIVKKGDFAMNQMDLLTGYVDISQFDGVTSPDYRVFQLFNANKDYPRYLLRLLQNCYHQRLFFPYGQGAAHLGRWRLPKDEFNNFLFPRPTYEEQQQIARFLDHETARIDALIAEQERLIDLLKEKRQAVISHAVTKGLDRTAPMKDFGVEWLGEVPAHWEVAKVKHVIQSFEQGWSPQCENVPIENDEEWGILKVGCVNGGIFSPTENKKLPDNLDPVPELFLKAGDVLISRANTRELVGSAALVDADQPNLMLSDKLFRLRVTDDMLPKYLVFYLGTSASRHQIELEATGASSSMLNIGQAVIKELSIPVPSVTEQQTITAHLEASLEKLYSLQTEAQVTQSLLQERRSALISAAVTGKIDVRGWQPAASAAPTVTLEAACG